MRYEKIRFVDSGKIIDVCLSSIRDEKDKLKPIYLSWFGGVKK